MKLVGYKEQDVDFETDDKDEVEEFDFKEIHKLIEEDEELKSYNIKLPVKNRQEKRRFLILKQQRERTTNYVRWELICTKSPINIEVAVKSKFDEIKCICDLKQEAYKKLIEISRSYNNLDLIKTRYLKQTIRCRRKYLR